MHGLPSLNQIESLIGKRLQHVCFGLHALQLIFEDNVEIYVESKISVSSESEHYNNTEDFRVLAQPLLELLGHPVSSLKIVSSHVLRVAWANGYAIDLHEDDEKFESFQIRLGEDWIVV